MLTAMISAALFAITPVALGAEIPRHRLLVQHFTEVGYNVVGARSQVGLNYRLRLYDTDSRLLQGSYLMFGPTAEITPLSSKVGFLAEFKPSVFTVFTARYDHRNYFGHLNSVLTTDVPTFDFSDTHRQEVGPDEQRAAEGAVLTLTGRLQLKIGPVAARYTMGATRNDLKVGEAYFYDLEADMLVPTNGWFATHDTDLIYVGGPLVVGARWTYTDGALGQTKPKSQETHRLGPLLALRFKDAGAGAPFAKPMILLMAQWHLEHAYRTGQDSPATLPQFALAFYWEGDVLPF